MNGRLQADAAVAVDVVLLVLDPDRRLLVALSRPRTREPESDQWALPGRRIRVDEDLEEAARSILTSSVNVPMPRHLEQLATFGAPDRDPRGRVVSVSYLALMPGLVDLPPDARWTPTDQVPDLTFDHSEILASALDRLRARLTYSNVAYGLLPDRFTLSDLQEVYETVLDRSLDKRNFRKKVLALDMLVETDEKRRGSHRPAQLYRFAGRGLVLLDDVVVAEAR